MSINNITVSGNLVRDPELRHLPSGDGVFENAVAIEHYRKDEENAVSFVDWKVYGAYSELLSKKLQKGDLVTVSGRIQQETWEKDGEKRSKLVIVAYEVEGDFKYRKNGAGAPEAAEAEEKPSAQTDEIPF